MHNMFIGIFAIIVILFVSWNMFLLYHIGTLIQIAGFTSVDLPIYVGSFIKNLVILFFCGLILQIYAAMK